MALKRFRNFLPNVKEIDKGNYVVLDATYDGLWFEVKDNDEIDILCYKTLEPDSTKTPATDTIRSIRVDRDKIWVPEIEVINRVYDFSPVDEIKRKLKIDNGGKVTFNRMYRLRTMMSSKIERYPFDLQVALMKIYSN